MTIELQSNGFYVDFASELFQLQIPIIWVQKDKKIPFFLKAVHFDVL